MKIFWPAAGFSTWISVRPFETIFGKISDYFSVDDPFTHDITEEDLAKISKLYAVGESPKDSEPIESHDSQGSAINALLIPI